MKNHEPSENHENPKMFKKFGHQWFFDDGGGARLGVESLVFLYFLSIKNGSWSSGTPNVFFVMGFKIRTIGFRAIAVFECVHHVHCHAGPGPALGARRLEGTVATPSPNTIENVLCSFLRRIVFLDHSTNWWKHAGDCIEISRASLS